MQVYKQTGKKPQQLLDQPNLDKEWKYLVDWYLEVRGSDDLTFTEIKNWSDLMHIRPSHWEVNVLKTLDRIYWKRVNQNG